MKNLRRLFFLCLLFPLSSAFANTYYGIITETITQSSLSQYQVGQIFYGIYQYESPTIDGNFVTPVSFSVYHTGTPTLDGALFVPDVQGEYVRLTAAQGADHDLTVAGGVVSSLEISQESFGHANWARFGYGPAGGAFVVEWYMWENPDKLVWEHVAGTLSITDPILGSPYHIPETASVAGLLTLPLLLLGLRGRRAPAQMRDRH